MSTSFTDTTILLGRGGKSPGIESYDPVEGQLREVASLPVGQSVYAIDASPDRQSFCAGTRSGVLHRFVSDGPFEGIVSNPIHCGAGLLSVCLLDPRRVATSDVAGRCLIWSGGDRQPLRLATDNRTICSLRRLGSEEMVGLAVKGGLLVWCWPQRSLVRAIDTPAVPGPSALVQLAYWPQADALVWPGRDGRLVLWKRDESKVHTLDAHEGEFYAIAICDERLFTVGREDSRLKCWQAEKFELVADCQAPDGVIHASVWKTHEYHILLVSDAGRADIYGFDGRQLSYAQSLSGSGYRVAWGPDPEKIHAAFADRQARRAGAIAAEIRDKAHTGEVESLEALHAELVECGYELMSFALRAEAARDKNDIVSELKAYKSIVNLSPDEDEDFKIILLRYAALLDYVWQLGCAREVYQRVLQVYPSDSSFLENIHRLAESIDILESKDFIVQTEIPVDILLQSATVMEKPLTGRYVIKSLEPRGTKCMNVSHAQIVKKCEQNRCARLDVSLPRAMGERPWLLSKDGAEQITTIAFAAADSSQLAGLQLVFQFLDAHVEKVLVPIMVFDAGSPQSGTDAQKHNNQALLKLQQIQNKALCNGWLRVVYRHASQSIRQLITGELTYPDTGFLNRRSACFTGSSNRHSPASIQGELKNDHE